MRLFLISLWLFTCSLVGFSQKLEVGTSSKYSNGAYHTTSVYMVDAPVSRLDAVLHEIYMGIQNQPTKNLKWLWKNLGHHDNVENDIAFSERGFSFDPATSKYVLKLGVAMKKGDNPMLFNVEGDMKEFYSGGRKNLLLTVTKRIKILDNARFSIVSVPQPGGKSAIQVKSDLDFGWFFSMFFSESRYRSIMEWRIQGLTMNIKKRAEGDTSSNY